MGPSSGAYSDGCSLSHVSRHISNFTLRPRDFFFSSLSLFLFGKASPPLFPPSPSSSFSLCPSSPCARLSLSLATSAKCLSDKIRRRVESHGAKSSRNRVDDKKWMLRNFRIEKTREMYFPRIPPPLSLLCSRLIHFLSSERTPYAIPPISSRDKRPSARRGEGGGRGTYPIKNCERYRQYLQSAIIAML